MTDRSLPALWVPGRRRGDPGLAGAPSSPTAT